MGRPTPTGNTTASFNATTTTSTPTPTPTTDITTSTTSTTTTTTTFTWPGHRNFNSGEDVFDPPPDVLVGGHPVPTADPGTGTSTPSLIQGSASITLSAGLWVSLVFGILLVCGIGVAVFRIIHERHSEATLKRNNSTALKSLQRAESVRRLSDPDLDDGAPTLMRTSSTKTVPPDLDIMSIGVAVTPITDFGSVTTGPRTGDFVTLDSVAVGGFGSTLNDIFGDANAVGGGATAGGVASTTYSGSESNSSKRGLPSVGGTTPTLMNSSSSSRDGDSTMWADETFMTLDNAIVVPPTGEGETAQSPIHPSSANPSPVTAAASPALHTEGHPSRPPPIFTHVSAMVSQASLYSSTSSAGPFNSGSSMWIDDASSEQKGPSPSVGSSAISVQDPFGDAESLDGHDRDDPFVDGKP
ncbi:hypothetical protein HK102_002906 [Quaeritorhiza haematococci]|nr:hypothetical protein HK102_002906 [Quaeritorhiza haematococci]